MDKRIDPPACQGPLAEVAPLEFGVPAGAWDCHFHVFGPVARFPYAVDRKYTPPDSPFENYIELTTALGIERGVCVHPNLHGPDNSVTFDAVARSEGRFKAIVKIDRDTTLADLREMKRAGTCGIRFAFNPQHGSGELDTVLFERAVGWCEDLDWVINLHFAPAALDTLAERLANLSLPTIIDHFGRVDVAGGVDQKHFKVLLELMGKEHMWMKLTGADRITSAGPPYDDVVPFAHALLDIAADRLVWGSDWPHSGYFEAARMPDDGELLNLVGRFAPTATLRQKILVDNPERLFGKR